MTSAVVVRPVASADLEELVLLIRAHAEYERAPAPRVDLAAALADVLFGGDEPDLRCLVAHDERGALVGYATCSPVTSTWEARRYMHLDCLYLSLAARGNQVGRRLFDGVVEIARTAGIHEVQWQTPSWNAGAIRFYDRIGAVSTDKRRYTLTLAPT